jgi:hypothetical protein
VAAIRHELFTSASWPRATMRGGMSGPYVEVLLLGMAVLVLTWLSQAWVIGSIALLMTLGVALAAVRDR